MSDDIEKLLAQVSQTTQPSGATPAKKSGSEVAKQGSDKPGGRFAVSDVLVRGEVPIEVRRNMELWMGCIAGALEEQEFLHLLREVGFEHASIEPTRIYSVDDAATLLQGTGLDPAYFARQIDGKFLSGFIRATKPTGTP